MIGCKHTRLTKKSTKSYKIVFCSECIKEAQTNKTSVRKVGSEYILRESIGELPALKMSIDRKHIILKYSATEQIVFVMSFDEALRLSCVVSDFVRNNNDKQNS